MRLPRAAPALICHLGRSSMQEFLTLATAHFLLLLIPGSDTALLTAQAVRFGRQVALATAWGMTTAFAVHVAYTLFGVAAFLRGHPSLMLATTALGATYLAWTGARLLRSKATGQATLRAVAAGAVAATPLPPIQGFRNAFARGFLNTISNVKVLLFFLTIFATIVHSGTPWWIEGLYALWIVAATLAWLLFMAIALSTPRLRGWLLGTGPWLERVAGTVLLLVALDLLFLAFLQHA